MRGIGRCAIVDLDMARIGKQHERFIQPGVSIYRSPEVMLCILRTAAADIWNVGVMVHYEQMFSKEGDHWPYGYVLPSVIESTNPYI